MAVVWNDESREGNGACAGWLGEFGCLDADAVGFLRGVRGIGDGLVVRKKIENALNCTCSD